MKKLFFLYLKAILSLGVIASILSCVSVPVEPANTVKPQNGKAILLILAQKGFDELEYSLLSARIITEGYKLVIASPDGGPITGERGLTVFTDKTIQEVVPADYEGMIITCRTKDAELMKAMHLKEIVLDFYREKRLVAAMGSAPLLLGQAGLLAGRKTTAWPSVKQAVMEAGADYVGGVLTESDFILTGIGGSDDNATRFVRAFLTHINGEQQQAVDIPFQLHHQKTRFVMSHAGLTRTGLLRIPSDYDPSQKYSLVFGLHGMGGVGLDCRRMEFDRIADHLQFITVYPDAYNGDWNIFPGRKSWVDDEGFFRALVKELSARYAIDSRRIYAVGHSEGGFMAHRLGYDMANVFSAVSSVAGLMYLPHSPAQHLDPVSVLHLHAVDDWNVPFAGDPVQENPVSVDKGILFWRTLNKTSEEPVTTLEKPGIRGTRWSNRHTNTDVEMIVYDTGGHTWLPYATELISDFFYNHPPRKNTLRLGLADLPAYWDEGYPVTITPLPGSGKNIQSITLTVNNQLVAASKESPFTLVWENPPPGTHYLTAEAWLTDGTRICSTDYQPIRITPRNLLSGDEAVSASSIEAPGFEAKNVLDRNPHSRWASGSGDPQWVTIDIGRIVRLEGVTLVWETAFASEYILEVSMAGEIWAEIFSNTEGKGGYEYITFSPAAARLLRIKGIRRGTRWGYSLWDVLLHGEAK